MLEIFTIGGGEYIVNVLNAVAAWCGGGGFRSLIRVVMVIGLIYALLVVAFSMNWRMWLNWFLGSVLIYGALIIPTTSVRVTDRLNPSLPSAVVDNVPIGLATVASVSSLAGDWMTRTAETVFVMPTALQLSSNGMIYGARLYDRTTEFKIRDPRVRSNLEEFFKQCLFYDIMLGHKTFASVANSTDILSDMGPGSPARAMKWLDSSGSSSVITCETAYNQLRNTDLPAETAARLTDEGRKIFPGLSAAAAKAKLDADIPVLTSAFHGASQSSEQVFHQRSLVDAFLEARANLGSADGDTFAMLRAEAQARNTYSSIAQQAMTWVPLLNIVLTVVFYAMFPVIFPLFLLPQTGVPALKGYFTGFFYLAAWGPLYAVLHMFIMERTAESMNAVAPGGITMAGMAGIDAVNSDTATIAGFLMMSIPFLAAGLARGAMAVSSQATSMLAPAQGAAEAAAIERTTGNYSYGNQSYMNLTGNVTQRDQWNSAPSYSTGFGRSTFQSADGTAVAQTAGGSMIYESRGGMSNLGFAPQVTASRSAEFAEAASELETRRQVLSAARSERVAALERAGFSTSSGSRTSSGSMSESGISEGATQAQSRRDGQSNVFTTGQGRTIGQHVDGRRSAQDQYTADDQTNWSVAASLGLPGGGGGRGVPGGRGGRGAVGTGISGNVMKTARDGVVFQDGYTETQSDRVNLSRNSSSSESQDVSDESRRESGAYIRDGSFSRNEGFSEDRSYRDNLVEDIRSIDRQLSEIDEASRTLSSTWTTREGGGATISQDMSQIVASRYYDEAMSARAEGLDVPLNPNQTDITPTQMASRNIVVDRILDKYIDETMAPVRDEMLPPTQVMGPVQGPSNFSEADLRGSGRGGGNASGGGGSSEVDARLQGAEAAIEEGREDVARGREGAARTYEQGVIGASDLNQRTQDSRRAAWWKDRN
ncbi:conjugal transfer protein TraG N-terminal domain-containing protein [Croceicoccus hydrothermalis]|uniref:conjugal transfer protein TraG N-terminal domain-containing protein n=1 Tax=Croceicoccus hydrothermalis TaxID=2867964 RepID=UPI001EFAE599|nr:conjugal transfer protein TraG N-terminal domain-containing protein [Croceicoccus hydrothermalis]